MFRKVKSYISTCVMFKFQCMWTIIASACKFFFVFRRENVQNLLSKLAGNYGGGRTVVASLTEMT